MLQLRHVPTSRQTTRVAAGFLLLSAAIAVTSVAEFPMRVLQSWVAGLKEPLAQRFPPTALNEGRAITGIIVLGGHIARVREAAKLAQLLPDAKIILAGAHGDEVAYLKAQNFAASRLTIDVDTTNTFENARFAAAAAAPKPGERWILVTSAYHMPRAQGTFRALGFFVDPWPTYDAHSKDRYVAPVVVHEILGLIAYRLLQRTQSFFPGPD